MICGRAATVSERLQANPGNEHAADLIEPSGDREIERWLHRSGFGRVICEPGLKAFSLEHQLIKEPAADRLCL